MTKTFSIVSFAAAFSFLLTGCDSGTYEEKFQTQLVVLQKETPFKEMFKEPTSFPNSPLTIRLPNILGEKTVALDASTPDPRDKALPLDAGRVQPEFLELPGYERTYERIVDAEDRTSRYTFHWPVYCYIAASSAAEQSGDDLADLLREELVAAFGEISDATKAEAAKSGLPPKGVGEWEMLTVPKPDGSQMQVRKLRAVGDQTFHHLYEKDQQIKAAFKLGEYWLYLYTGNPDYHVMIAWRAPIEALREIDLQPLAETCLGTIDFTEADQAQSKLDNL